MKCTAVTVTYANRFAYLVKVINSLIEQEIDKIVIVSNGSEEASLLKIKELANRYSCIELIDFTKNTGSANGFSSGISRAYKLQSDFIWLLDDDNMPKKKALENLKKSWNNIAPKSKKLKMLLSYRSDREVYKQSIQNSNPFLMLGKQNSFLGFDWAKVFRKNKSITKDTSITIGKVAVAPYGGMFFHRSLVDQIGLPNKNLFLYSDDYDFSYRITKKKEDILLILESEIIDLETSFHLKKKKSIISSRFFKTNSKVKIFYFVRNAIFFEKNFVTNKFIYVINTSIYITLIIVMMLLKPSHFWKLGVIIKAIFAVKKIK